MRVFYQRLEANIGPKQALTLIVAVILGLGIIVHDTHAGFCRFDSSCCSSNKDCPQNDFCVFKSGVCYFEPGPSTFCNDDSECGEPDSCVFAGVCVGGDNDGEFCFSNMGYCSWPFSFCRIGSDCPEGGECLSIDMCTGGTCELCGGGCYIATATLGTELQYKIGVLQSFRDKYLLNSSLGKAFVTAYYRYSPPIADYISERAWLRFLVRILLFPVVGLASLFV